MREVPAPGALRDTSHFLISYSHAEHNGKRNDRGSEQDPDHWVIGFYKDLCRTVERLAQVPAGMRPGVLDRDLWVEGDWCAGLPEALATCHVLVPLFSSRCFHSEACGKEWYVFADRAAGQGTGPAQAPAIVPVPWSPMTPDSIHEVARAVSAVSRHDVDCHLGERAPLRWLYDADAAIALVGVGYSACTAFHLAEYRLSGELPLREHRCFVTNGCERRKCVFRDIDLIDDDFETLGAAFDAASWPDAASPLRRGRVGVAPATLLSMRGAVDFARAWMEEHRDKHDR